jgi:hypothetical protein
MKWSKSAGDVWTWRGGPFSLRVSPKGDGRWTWAVFSGEAQNPTATGIGSSLGAAKSTAEQFVKRSGLI